MRCLLMVAMLVFGLFAGHAGAGSREEGLGGPEIHSLEERREALARQAGLDERERELIGELLAWDARIEAARREQERLRQEIPALERSLAGAGAALAESRVRLDESTERLGWWVNFLYRCGPAAYLEVILGAADFNDFVERAEMVKMIIAGQVKLLEEVRRLAAGMQEQVAALERTRAELAAKNSLIAVKIQEMEDFRAGREEFLAGLRRQSAELANRIIGAETSLYRSLDSLHRLLAGLDSMPWHRLAPDRFYPAGRGFQIEWSEREINRTFFEQGDAALAGLSVQCAPGRFTISGTAPAGGVDFRLEGNFIPAGEGKVRFQPERAFLAGLPVRPEVLELISSEHGLTVDAGSYLQGYRLREIRVEEGRLVVLLAPA
ncbi:MAG: hypothetical protein K6T29_00535 [Peptococcaceae bacterium]|nr:hypothetical protein [Peptococcaceae bacterium]